MINRTFKYKGAILYAGKTWEELRKEWDYLQNGGLEKIRQQRLREIFRKVAMRRHGGELLSS